MKHKYELVWDNCLKIIKDNISINSYKTWFEPIKAVKLEDNVLTIQVPSQFFYEWLEEYYVNLLRKTIKRELGKDAKLEYRIVVDNNSIKGSQGTINLLNDRSNTYNVNNMNLNNPGSVIKNPFIIPGLKKLKIDPQLNPTYTFESFVEGECNKLARAAGIAVAKSPGITSFNPLVIWGDVGIGKTHLAHAIGNQAKSLYPNKSVLYVSSEKFANQFVNALKENNINDFIHFYQMIDILIVDDIEFFENKAKTQDVFFHIFNHLHQTGKQLILTMDKPPKDLEGVEERLLSRFKWGLSTDVKEPSFETRMAILQSRLHRDGVEMPYEIIEFIAYNIKTVRDLVGATTTILAESTLTKREITIEMAKRVATLYIKNASKEIQIETIQNVVCEYFEVTVDKLKGKTRKRPIVQARQLSMFFAKQYTKHSLKSIGSYFGDRDHSTVIHSCQAVRDQIDTDSDFKESVEELKKRIELSL
ncbi:MAG: chromosomal replication initiator protein DnaA [Chitinophagales bacterium]|nr:chromosomal replication initiator protein DnaA [Chitinophagales bacterium]